MKVYRGFPFRVEQEERAIALGFFDGVHLGHQKLLDQLLRSSRKRNLSATVFTFDMHPGLVLQKSFSFKGLIQSNPMRLKKLQEFGVEEVILAPLSEEVSHIPAEEFYFDYLVERFGMRSLIVGEDAHFGYRGAGDVKKLQAWSEQSGSELFVIPDLEIACEKVSSTLIRKLLENGEIRKANSLLGYPHQISGEVRQGKRLGRTLGFPTINLDYDPELVRLKFGVYVSEVLIGRHVYPSITSVGTNPTVEQDSSIKVETYIYNQNMNLYDTEVSIALLDFVRPEMRFADLEEMQERILQDLRFVEDWHKEAKSS